MYRVSEVTHMDWIRPDTQQAQISRLVAAREVLFNVFTIYLLRHIVDSFKQVVSFRILELNHGQLSAAIKFLSKMSEGY